MSCPYFLSFKYDFKEKQDIVVEISSNSKNYKMITNT